MQLFSSAYFVFLVAIFFLYWPASRMRALALGLILLANYFFYARWDWVYLLLIPAASTCDFLIGLGLQDFQSKALRRLLVTLSILMNIGILAASKYMPFFLENWAGITGGEVREWNWVLPITLSFYVFQALTYTIDLYRRDAKGTRSYLAHLAAVSFFPTTLAGPITRVSNLIKQMEERKPLEATAGGRGLFLIGMGLSKKLLIADYLGSNLINRVFDFPALYSGTEVLFAAYGYSLQLYYDFSGYTDIAIGSALLLGITLPVNFNQPYAAVNIADFWRRWHITLSNWLRDYLYFSLPGKRGKVFPYTNLIITMVIGGLWHGAGWTFIIWGALHGVGLVIVRLWQTAWQPAKPSRPSSREASASPTATPARGSSILSLGVSTFVPTSIPPSAGAPESPTLEKASLQSPAAYQPKRNTPHSPSESASQSESQKGRRNKRRRRNRTGQPETVATPAPAAAPPDRSLPEAPPSRNPQQPVARPEPQPKPRLEWRSAGEFGTARTASAQPSAGPSTRPGVLSNLGQWALSGPGAKFASIFLTFHFVTFAWIFFRAADVATAWTILERIASGSVSFVNITGSLWMVAGVGLVAHYIPARWYQASQELYMRAPFYAQAAVLAALVMGLQYVVRTGAAPFIYNQF